MSRFSVSAFVSVLLLIALVHLAGQAGARQENTQEDPSADDQPTQPRRLKSLFDISNEHFQSTFVRMRPLICQVCKSYGQGLWSHWQRGAPSDSEKQSPVKPADNPDQQVPTDSERSATATASSTSTGGDATAANPGEAHFDDVHDASLLSRSEETSSGSFQQWKRNQHDASHQQRHWTGPMHGALPSSDLGDLPHASVARVERSPGIVYSDQEGARERRPMRRPSSSWSDQQGDFNQEASFSSSPAHPSHSDEVIAPSSPIAPLQVRSLSEVHGLRPEENGDIESGHPHRSTFTSSATSTSNTGASRTSALGSPISYEDAIEGKPTSLQPHNEELQFNQMGHEIMQEAVQRQSGLQESAYGDPSSPDTQVVSSTSGLRPAAVGPGEDEATVRPKGPVEAETKGDRDEWTVGPVGPAFLQTDSHLTSPPAAIKSRLHKLQHTMGLLDDLERQEQRLNLQSRLLQQIRSLQSEEADEQRELIAHLEGDTETDQVLSKLASRHEVPQESRLQSTALLANVSSCLQAGSAAVEPQILPSASDMDRLRLWHSSAQVTDCLMVLAEDGSATQQRVVSIVDDLLTAFLLEGGAQDLLRSQDQSALQDATCNTLGKREFGFTLCPS